jgi:NADPH2:quinone reductase
MKALLCTEYGEPEKLLVQEIDRPEPGPGQIRIRVHACGVNFADTLIIQGLYQVKPVPPFSPGLELAGQVSALGEGVTTVKIGDKVACVASHGGMAEEVVVDAGIVIPIPTGLSCQEAAAFPVAYGTSHLGLWHRAKLQPGENLLVLGASGGVGLTAVQIGKQMGANVIAAASTDAKLDVAKSAGADHLINYDKLDLREAVKALGGADVIYDPVGGPLLKSAMRAINWEGRIIVIGFASGDIPQIPANILLVKNISAVGLFWGAYAERNPELMRQSLKQLMTWRVEGKFAPHISKTYSLEDAPQAFMDLANRKSTGKLVIQLCDEC